MGIVGFRIGSPRARGEGLRVGAVRFLPRGVRKQDYARLDYFDVWMPLLAPSRELVAWARRQDLSDAGVRRRFFARYRRELLGGTEARQTLVLVARLGESADLSVGCYCADESRCHRSELLRLLRSAASESA